MTAALLLAAGSCTAFVVCAWIFSQEASRGRRFFAPKLRGWFDGILARHNVKARRNATYLGRHIITLSWYYSLHAFLKLLLQFLAGVYGVVEAVLHRNRARARVIRTERKHAQRSHLTELADHKIETKLTEGQKKKRNDAALNGRS